jgi:para-aminobenzoate synthetase component I
MHIQRAPISISNATSWQQHPLSLTRYELSLLCKTLDRAVLLDGNVSQHKPSYIIFSASPEFDANIQDLQSQNSRQTIPSSFASLPFVCGHLGFVSYDYAESLTVSKQLKHGDSGLPDYSIGYYAWSYVQPVDKTEGVLTISPQASTKTRRALQRALEQLEKLATDATLPAPKEDFKLNWRHSSSKESYDYAFNRVQNYILDGDTYQVNLTQRYETTSPLPPSELYFSLKRTIDAPYCCYLAINPQQAVLSFSPEQFIQIKDRKITTRPIKGTAVYKDELSAKKLKNSDKDLAENLMIVDLMRNDLSKVCKPKSVRTPDLFAVERHKELLHLVSTITGSLRNEISEFGAFLSCFPGGSITGAPKKRAMEIISEIETHGRGAYCGSIFYCNDNGNFDSNILIRTIVANNEHLFCWGGGGIVADSTLESEYRESIIKVEHLTGQINKSK